MNRSDPNGHIFGFLTDLFVGGGAETAKQGYEIWTGDRESFDAKQIGQAAISNTIIGDLEEVDRALREKRYGDAFSTGVIAGAGTFIPGAKLAAHAAEGVGNVRGVVKAADGSASKAPLTAGGRTGFSGSRGSPLEQPTYQPARNNPTTIGERTYSGHALDQMQNRGIPPSAVEDAISPSNYVGPGNRPDIHVYQNPANGIRVVTNNGGDVVTVITVPRR